MSPRSWRPRMLRRRSPAGGDVTVLGRCADYAPTRRFTGDVGVGGRAARDHARLPGRLPARQQLVQQDTEAVHVGRRGGGLTPDLFRRRVVGCQRTRALLGHRVIRRVLVQQLRDAEIEQLYVPVRTHEHVPGLQVAMHHEPLVGVLHGLADGEEQVDPLRNRQPVPIAVTINGLTLNVLHREPGFARSRETAVVEPCNVRMCQARQDPALPPEPLDQVPGIEAGSQALERYALTEIGVVPFGQVHDAHAAPPEFADSAPGSDGLVQWPGLVIFQNDRERFRPAIEQRHVHRVSAKKGLHLASQLRIGGAARKPRLAFTGIGGERRVEQLVDSIPTIRIDGHAGPPLAGRSEVGTAPTRRAAVRPCNREYVAGAGDGSLPAAGGLGDRRRRQCRGASSS